MGDVMEGDHLPPPKWGTTALMDHERTIDQHYSDCSECQYVGLCAEYDRLIGIWSDMVQDYWGTRPQDEPDYGPDQPEDMSQDGLESGPITGTTGGAT